MKQICCFRWTAKTKRFSASGGGLCSLTPDQGLCPGSRWGLRPRHRYRLALRGLAVHVHPTFFDLATPLDNCRSASPSDATAVNDATTYVVLQTRRHKADAAQCCYLYYTHGRNTTPKGAWGRNPSESRSRAPVRNLGDEIS